MKTDWDLIRNLLNAAVDACETVEKLGITEEDRSLMYTEGNQDIATVYDFLQSSWTYPESLTDNVIRYRHELKANEPYINELSRTLIKVAELSARTVNAKDHLTTQLSDNQTMKESVEKLISWYRDYMIPNLTKTIEQKKHKA